MTHAKRRRRGRRGPHGRGTELAERSHAVRAKDARMRRSDDDGDDETKMGDEKKKSAFCGLN